MSSHDCRRLMRLKQFYDGWNKHALLWNAAIDACIDALQEEKGNETETNPSSSTDAEVRLTESGA